MTPEQALILQFTRAHRDIPMPQVGHVPAWRKRNPTLCNLNDDHRKCPAVQYRNRVGITVFMPYTLKIFRGGVLEVSNLAGVDDQRVFRFDKFDIDCKGVSREPFNDFSSTRIDIPVKCEEYPLKIFMIGDQRLDSWIVDSGIIIESAIPRNYRYLITPVPYFVYPSNITIGQGITVRSGEPGPIRHLKIPIDLERPEEHLDDTPVVLKRNTPMAQWLLVRVPEVSLEEVTTRKSFVIKF